MRKYGRLKDCNTSVHLVRMHDKLLKWVKRGHSFVDNGAIDFQKVFDLINHIVPALNLKLMGAKKNTHANVGLSHSEDAACVWFLRS